MVLSTIEAEYIICSTLIQEVVWLKRVMQRFGIKAWTSNPVEIHTSSMVAFAYLKDPMYNGGTKHIDIQFYYICDIVKQR